MGRRDLCAARWPCWQCLLLAAAVRAQAPRCGALASVDGKKPSVASGLLQTSRATAARSPPEQSPAFQYDRESMWGFDDPGAAWSLQHNGSTCSLRFPASSLANASAASRAATASRESGFALGRCPGVWAPRRRWRIDLALPAPRNQSDRLHPGTNPAIIRLPAALTSSFPQGRWLAASRVGWARCPGMEDFQVGTLPFLGNLWGNGTYLAVLDEDFAVVDKAKIAMTGAEAFIAIEDARLWVAPSHEVIISFMAYSQADRLNTLVAKLRLDAPGGRLQAWVERHEVRRAQECVSHPRAKKNLGFFADGASTYVLDRVHPTKIDRTDLRALEEGREREILQEHNHTYSPRLTLAALCLDASVPGSAGGAASTAGAGPWHACAGQLTEIFLHNGPHPLFIEEANIFLGLGHLVRGETTFQSGYKLPDHYTHQFFALSGTPPFRLVALSPEFCFSSEQDPEDCESIQFASSLLRDGDDLLVGFGVQDCDAFVHQYDLHEVLRSLAAVP